jgi:prophage regulatory protein
MIVHRLLKLPDVTALSAKRTTKLYDEIKKGLFVPPVRLSDSGRTVAWPESEVAAINDARIAGKSDAEIRELVSKLVAARAQPNSHAA